VPPLSWTRIASVERLTRRISVGRPGSGSLVPSVPSVISTSSTPSISGDTWRTAVSMAPFFEAVISTSVGASTLIVPENLPSESVSVVRLSSSPFSSVYR